MTIGHIRVGENPLEGWRHYFERFTDTPYDKKAVKRTFFNVFTRWLIEGCDQAKFTKTDKPMYHGLSQHLFGHIAEYSRYGFYDTWFSTPQRRAQWARYAMGGGAYGLTSLTRDDLWGDVEHALVSWLHDEGIGDKLIEEGRSDVERGERAELQRLLRKYPDVIDPCA